MGFIFSIWTLLVNILCFVGLIVFSAGMLSATLQGNLFYAIVFFLVVVSCGIVLFTEDLGGML